MQLKFTPLTFTVDGRMPVNAADFLVLSIFLVDEILINHQIFGSLSRPVVVLRQNLQGFTVVYEDVHDHLLLKVFQCPKNTHACYSSSGSVNH